MKTTLNEIRAKSPCADGWKKLLAHLGKTQADDEQVSIVTILDSNGLDDALWCLQAVKGSDREIRLFGVWCARQVQRLMADPRSLAALDVAERFANGNATSEELDAAEASAWASAWASASVSASVSAKAKAGAGAAAEASAWASAWASARAAQEKRLRELCAECELATK